MAGKTNENAVSELIAQSVSSGVLRANTSSMLLGDLGAVVIAGAAGMDLEAITATDVTLVTLLIDASSSIHGRGLEAAVREGQNLVLEAFAKSREKESILVALWSFSDDVNVLHSYVPVDDAVRLDASNYRALGGTRLYDVWCDALAANVAYAERLRESGTPCRSIVVVVTDGEDCGSKRTQSECRALSNDLLASERFVLAFVGVGDATDFAKVAKNMGVPQGSVEVLANATPKALREAFRMVSQSAIRASAGAIRPGVNAGFFQP